MTTREKLQKMLVNNGMFETQAKQVIDIAIPELNDLVEDYKINFDSSASEYQNVVHDILFLAIKPIALKWIEENVPMAWYKPMFMSKEKTKAVTLSLTEQEEKDLIQVSRKFLGQSNKSGMVRYWIKKAKDESNK